jgi:UDP-glucose 4-epimerase
MSKPKATVVVTGVAGFIGSNLAERLLAEGYHVVGIDNLAYGVVEQIPPAVEFYQLDIRDQAIVRIVKGADAVFHLAAKNCISDCQQDPVGTASINVVGSVNVFEACWQARVRKVVYAESSALYEGSSVFPTPERESAPESFYALSKAAERHFANGYCRFRGLNATALRYFCVYGPRQDYRRTIPPVMSAFIIKLARGERPTIYGTGEKRRDFVYVDDVNDFHMLCLTDAHTDGRTFNIGSGKSHSVREIYEVVKRLLGSALEPIYAPDLPGEAIETRADITAARQLGWEPQTDLEEGVRRSIEYIRANVVVGSALSRVG